METHHCDICGAAWGAAGEHVMVAHASVVWPLPESDLGWTFTITDAETGDQWWQSILGPDAIVTQDDMRAFTEWAFDTFEQRGVLHVAPTTQEELDSVERFVASMRAFKSLQGAR